MVIGNVTDLMGMSFVPPRPSRRMSDGMSHSLPILICWKAR